VLTVSWSYAMLSETGISSGIAGKGRLAGRCRDLFAFRSTTYGMTTLRTIKKPSVETIRSTGREWHSFVTYERVTCCAEAVRGKTCRYQLVTIHLKGPIGWWSRQSHREGGGQLHFLFNLSTLLSMLQRPSSILS
jgi:hypothetical protein